jgi:hypothetical protein
MRYPTIHLNGTNGRVLLKEYTAAGNLLGATILALEAVTVHGRDYYVQNTATDPDASCEAMDEHQARLRKLRDVYTDLVLITGEIQSQLEYRQVSKESDT